MNWHKVSIYFVLKPLGRSYRYPAVSLSVLGSLMVDCPPVTTALSIRIDMRHVPGSTCTNIVYLLLQSAYILEGPVLKVIGRWCSLLSLDDSLDLIFLSISSRQLQSVVFVCH